MALRRALHCKLVEGRGRPKMIRRRQVKEYTGLINKDAIDRA